MVPPGASEPLGAGIYHDVVVPVFSGERLAVVIFERVSCIAREAGHREPVVVGLVCYRERVVLGVAVISVEVLHVDSQLVWPTRRQAVDQLVTQPELASDVAEAVAVAVPVAVEVELLRVVLTPLEHGPAAAVRLHVAEHGGGRVTLGQPHPVLAAGGDAQRRQIRAVADDAVSSRRQLRHSTRAHAVHAAGALHSLPALVIGQTAFAELSAAEPDEGGDGGGVVGAAAPPRRQSAGEAVRGRHQVSGDARAVHQAELAAGAGVQHRVVGVDGVLGRWPADLRESPESRPALPGGVGRQRRLGVAGGWPHTPGQEQRHRQSHQRCNCSWQHSGGTTLITWMP